MKKSPRRRKPAKRKVAFTLVELLTVMAIIAVLAGLVLSTAGFVQQKAARSRAEAEIKAMEAALENYRGDNGDYPRHATASLGINTATVVSTGSNAQRVLYQALTGDGNNALITGGIASNGRFGSVPNSKIYFEPRKEMLSGTGANTKLADPWGTPYNYAIQSSGTDAFNPGAFDLWSQAGTTGTAGRPKWIKNW